MESDVAHDVNQDEHGQFSVGGHRCCLSRCAATAFFSIATFCELESRAGTVDPSHCL